MDIGNEWNCAVVIVALRPGFRDRPRILQSAVEDAIWVVDAKAEGVLRSLFKDLKNSEF
jgi:hypothetical protein